MSEQEKSEEADEHEIADLTIPLEAVSAEVEEVFHGSYLVEDREETQEKVEAKRVLRQVIDIAEQKLPTLTREMEKCRN